METIKSRSEFERVFTCGKRLSDRLLRVRVARLEDGAAPGKVAFVAPKRLGNAVFRNRCKRVLREAARQWGLPREGVDVILMATKDTHDSHPDEVAASLGKLMRRDGL